MTTMQQTEEWKINKRGRGCSACNRPFRSEEEHYSGIVEVEGRFERRDLCVPCWSASAAAAASAGQGPALFSFWKTRMPRKEERRLEDINAMQEFFKKLIEKPSEDLSRQKITYLTALLLARKRRLKLAGSKDGRLRIEKGWDGESIEIADPPIDDAELEVLKGQMEALFEVEFSAGE